VFSIFGKHKTKFNSWRKAMFDEIPPNNHTAPKTKILLADDDKSFRRFVEIILQRANYQVLTADDGLSALQIAQENKVHAVIADAIMPNLTGFDLCRILRENPVYQNIPFIILSGYENDSENHLADAYLLKENNLTNSLLKTLSNLLFLEKSPVN
jgi:two-component system, chemotaxis family, sensor kinase CheA